MTTCMTVRGKIPDARPPRRSGHHLRLTLLLRRAQHQRAARIEQLDLAFQMRQAPDAEHHPRRLTVVDEFFHTILKASCSVLAYKLHFIVHLMPCDANASQRVPHPQNEAKVECGEGAYAPAAAGVTVVGLEPSRVRS